MGPSGRNRLPAPSPSESAGALPAKIQRQSAVRTLVKAIGHAPGMLDLHRLVFGTVRVACGRRYALLLENLVLRQQLAVLLRTRRRPPLRRRDKLF